MLRQEANKKFILPNPNLKCGEIYFLENILTFACIRCELKIDTFLEFKLHFDGLHFKDFARDAESYNNLKEETLQNTKDDSNDPLSWMCDNKTVFEAQFEDCLKLPPNEIKTLTQPSSPLVNAEQGTEKNLQLPCDSDDLERSCSSLSVDADNVTSTNNKIDWTKPYNPKQNNKKRTYKPRNIQNTCTYCGRTFRRRYQLDTHLNIHTGEKPNQCDICGLRFRALTTLQRHLNTHEKRKDYVCKFCDKRFSHRAALISHESRHVQQRTISCDECEKKFYTLNQCDTHKRRVHNKSNANLPCLPFACDVCNKRYRSASMLSTHKLKKHLKSAKFFCEKCDKKFVDKEKLQQHQNIHINKAEKN